MTGVRFTFLLSLLFILRGPQDARAVVQTSPDSTGTMRDSTAAVPISPPGSSQGSTVAPDLKPDTRRERLIGLRLARKDSLRRPELGFVSRLILRAEQSRLVDRLSRFELYGFRPRFGGIVGGAGRTIGVRFDPAYPARDWTYFLEGLVSSRRYWQARMMARDRPGSAMFFGFIRYRHLPVEAFYGTGPMSAESAESYYRHDEFLAGLLAGIRPGNRWATGVQLGLQASRTGEGRDSDLPDIESRFDPDDVSGFGRPVNYLITGIFAEWDGRDIRDREHGVRSYSLADQSLRGLSFDANRGFYMFTELIHRLPLAGRSDAGMDPGFLEGRMSMQEYVPMREELLGFAFQQAVSYAVPTSSHDGIVPFYLLPSLGGRSSLRGFDDLRFRDRGLVLLNAEYRWQVWHFLDLAVFTDAGQVFHDPQDLAWSNFAASFGSGIRFKKGTLHSGQRTTLRFDVAWSEEGARTMFTVGGVF